MNNIFSEKLISLQELALFTFALLLLAAAPASRQITETPQQQPVKAVVPAEEQNQPKLNAA